MKLAVAFLTLCISVLLQLKLGIWTGWAPNITLGTLVACAAFFSAGELLALTLAAIFLLAWQPSLGAESAVLAVLPFLALLLYRRIPFFRGLPGLLAASAGAALAFTALSRPSFFLAEPFLTLADAAGSVIFAMIVFALFRGIYGERIVY